MICAVFFIEIMDFWKGLCYLGDLQVYFREFFVMTQEFQNLHNFNAELNSRVVGPTQKFSSNTYEKIEFHYLFNRSMEVVFQKIQKWCI